ncbi:tRNA (guanine(26)-N(2))-dimethyltransferase [Candidatus Woesearchaeota archaeon]|nr:tRNA (guanine(26)-N(2))-dimethyltransferase [Candidatus Woesearchaeota archaeon]
MKIIKEATTKILAEEQKIVDKKMPVFYNPVMKLNRDITILLLQAIWEQGSEHRVQTTNHKPQVIADPLAGSGIRSIRMIKELPQNITKEILVNDKKENYKEYMKKNIELNKLNEEQSAKIKIYNEDANTFLFENRPFDYIDIDPFGTPNPFLDSAIRSLRSDGILAVTATDTSALCGSYPKACKRKYWAEPLRNELMHEIGLRILIRKVQLMGTNHQRALVPTLSYSHDHYMRIFFRFDKGKQNMDKVLKQHEPFMFEGKEYGPIWSGQLNDLELLKKILSETEKEETQKNIEKRTIKLLQTLKEETQIEQIGFYDIHTLAKGKEGTLPKFETIIKKLEEKGYKASRTHFRDTAIKTDAPKEEVIKLIKK